MGPRTWKMPWQRRRRHDERGALSGQDEIFLKRDPRGGVPFTGAARTSPVDQNLAHHARRDAQKMRPAAEIRLIGASQP